MGWFKKRNYTSELDPNRNKSWTGYDPRVGTVKDLKAENAETELPKFINQNTMTKQDYITAIRNREYCIENDGLESLKATLKETFPEDTSSIYGSHSFYMTSIKSKNLWSAVKHRNHMKSIKASTLANMKDETVIKVTPENAQRIVNIACIPWKIRLADLWSKSIVFNQTIEISQSFYQEMRSACTPEQHKLFDEIFGPEFKVGDLVVPDNIDPEQVFKIEGISSGFNHIESLSSGSTRCVASVRSCNLRHATPEEIRTVQYPPNGTPCWVREGLEPWSLRYADGKGDFYCDQMKSGLSVKFNHSMPFDPNNLPFNT